MLDPTKEGYPSSKGKEESPRKIVGGMGLHLESYHIPARDTQKGQTKPCVYQETPQRKMIMFPN